MKILKHNPSINQPKTLGSMLDKYKRDGWNPEDDFKAVLMNWGPTCALRQLGKDSESQSPGEPTHSL